MSERSWFSYRYAVPGFMLVFLFFLTNLEPIIDKIQIHKSLGLDIAAIVGVLTFLSGPALGFIFVQLWYRLFDWRFRYRFGDPWIKLLIDKKIVDEENRDTDADYWVFPRLEKKHLLYNYITRRWDLYHTLCSTALAISIGLIVGYIIRIILHFLNMGGSWNWILHVPILLISVLSWYILFLSKNRIRQEHQNMLVKFVKEEIEKETT